MTDKKTDKEFNTQSDEEKKFKKDKKNLKTLWENTALFFEISKWDGVKGDRFEVSINEIQVMRDIESEKPYKAPVLVQKITIKAQNKNEPTPISEEMIVSFKKDSDGDAHIAMNTTGNSTTIAFEGTGLNKANNLLLGWIINIQETYKLDSDINDAVAKNATKKTKTSKPSPEGK